MLNVIKKVSIYSVIVIISIVFVISSGCLISMYSVLSQVEDEQINRISELQSLDESNEYQGVVEQDFCSFDLNVALTAGVKYNELKYISSHNSYKQGITGFSNLMFNTFGRLGGVKKNEYNYSHPTLTEQFNNGIRFIDIDLGYMVKNGEKRIICTHHPILDNKSSAIDYELALKEIYLWSKNNPNHIPLTIFVEPKDDFLYLPMLKPFGIDGIIDAEDKAREVLGDMLYTPSDMLRDYDNFNEMLVADNWPEINDMLGKVLFLLYPDNNQEQYERDETLSEQAFFMAEWYHSYTDNIENYSINTPFILTNDPDCTLSDNSLAIEYFLERDFMVRTRLDYYPDIDEERIALAKSSGAQILSTDFLSGSIDERDYISSFDDGYTISLCEE